MIAAQIVAAELAAHIDATKARVARDEDARRNMPLTRTRADIEIELRYGRCDWYVDARADDARRGRFERDDVWSGR